MIKLISASELQKELGLSSAYFRVTVWQGLLPFKIEKINGRYLLTPKQYRLFKEWYQNHSRPRPKKTVDTLTQK